MKKHYRRIITGATFYGCGLAAAAPEDTLVIEPSILVGSDFTLNFNPGKEWDYVPSQPSAAAFKAELKKRAALVGGRIHQPALTPVFSRWCLEHRLDVALATRVLERHGNELTVFDAGGRHGLTADEIIDASPAIGKTKRITASLLTDGSGRDFAGDRFEIVAGRFSAEAFLLMPLPAATAWPEARMLLLNAWQERPSELRACRIAAVGVRFDYHNFINPVMALDCGLNGGGK